MTAYAEYIDSVSSKKSRRGRPKKDRKTIWNASKKTEVLFDIILPKEEVVSSNNNLMKVSSIIETIVPQNLNTESNSTSVLDIIQKNSGIQNFINNSEKDTKFTLSNDAIKQIESVIQREISKFLQQQGIVNTISDSKNQNEPDLNEESQENVILGATENDSPALINNQPSNTIDNVVKFEQPAVNNIIDIDANIADTDEISSIPDETIENETSTSTIDANSNTDENKIPTDSSDENPDNNLKSNFNTLFETSEDIVEIPMTAELDLSNAPDSTWAFDKYNSISKEELATLRFELKKKEIESKESEKVEQPPKQTPTTRKKRQKREKSKLQLLREKHGIEAWEIAEKLGKQKTHYKTIEKNNGYSSPDKQEEFMYQFYRAITEITKERKQKSTKLFASMKPNKKGFLEEQLIYPPLTDELFNEAIKIMKEKHKNIVQVSIQLGIDEEALQKRISETEEHKHLLEEIREREKLNSKKYKQPDVLLDDSIDADFDNSIDDLEFNDDDFKIVD